MRLIRIIQFVLLFAALFCQKTKLLAQIELDFESGIVATGYNKQRILECSAENKTVYTFSLFHYFAIGTMVQF